MESETKVIMKIKKLLFLMFAMLLLVLPMIIAPTLSSILGGALEIEPLPAERGHGNDWVASWGLMIFEELVCEPDRNTFNLFSDFTHVPGSNSCSLGF